MKILVLGGTGMAGHTIAIYFKEAKHNVTVFSRKKVNFCTNIIGDATNFDYLEKIIIDGRYDAIINAIGILNQDAERNKSIAILLNSYLPHFLSEVTCDMNTKIIHLSTDCVFSGKIGGYSEMSFRDGDSFYDRSKALGELVNNRDLTFRNSIIGPDMNEEGIGLFNWFMKQEENIDGYCKAIWSGVTTLTLAKAMEQALQDNLSGIYNLVNNESISKYELLNLLNKHMKEGRVKIYSSDSLSINRSLVNNRVDFSYRIPSYETMVIEMKEWIDRHKELYPHYFRKDETK
jgi:dTDP-4-dehydrorhamnose reductase